MHQQIARLMERDTPLVIAVRNAGHIGFQRSLNALNFVGIPSPAMVKLYCCKRAFGYRRL